MEPEHGGANGNAEEPTAAVLSHAAKPASTHKETTRQSLGDSPTAATAVTSPTHSAGLGSEAIRQNSDAGVAVRALRPTYQKSTAPEISRQTARPIPLSISSISPPLPLSPPLLPLKPRLPPQSLPTEPSSVTNVPAQPAKTSVPPKPVQARSSVLPPQSVRVSKQNPAQEGLRSVLVKLAKWFFS